MYAASRTRKERRNEESMTTGKLPTKISTSLTEPTFFAFLYLFYKLLEIGFFCMDEMCPSGIRPENVYILRYV